MVTDFTTFTLARLAGDRSKLEVDQVSTLADTLVMTSSVHYDVFSVQKRLHHVHGHSYQIRTYRCARQCAGEAIASGCGARGTQKCERVFARRGHHRGQPNLG